MKTTTKGKAGPNMKKEILSGMRPPGWERLSDEAREAVLCELVALPEDCGEHPVREIAPSCARVAEVIDALRRAAARDGLTASDRIWIDRWQSLGHAGSIAVLLDLATIGADVLSTVARSESDLIGGPCIECGETIQTGEDYERLATTRGAREVHRECRTLRMVGHEYGVCSCTQYANQPTARAAALELARRMAERQIARRGAMS